MIFDVDAIFNNFAGVDSFYADDNNVFTEAPFKDRTVGSVKNDMKQFAAEISGNIEKETNYKTRNADMPVSTISDIRQNLQDASTYDGIGDLHNDALKVGRTQRHVASHTSAMADRNEKRKALKKAQEQLDAVTEPSITDRILGKNRRKGRRYNSLKAERDKAQQDFDDAKQAVADYKSQYKEQRRQRIIDNTRSRYKAISDNYDQIKSYNESLKKTYLDMIDHEGYEKLQSEWDKKAPAVFDSSKYDVSTPEGTKALQEAKAKHQELVDKHAQGFKDQIKTNKENLLKADLDKYREKAKDAFQEQIIEARRRGEKFEVTDDMIDYKMQSMMAKDYNVSVADARRGIDILNLKTQEQKLEKLKDIVGSRLDSYDTSEKDVKGSNGKITKEKDFKALASRKAGSSGVEKAISNSLSGKAKIFGGVAAAALATVGIGSMMMSGGRQSNSNLYNPYQAMY